MRVIVIAQLVLLALAGGATYVFYDDVFGEKETESTDTATPALSANEEKPLEKEGGAEQKPEENAAKEEPQPEEAPQPMEEEEEEEEEEATPDGPGRQFAEVEITAPPRPKASDEASLKLVKNFLTVTGGKEKHDQIQNIVAEGTVKISTQSKRFRLIETQDGKRHLRYSWKLLGRRYQELYVFDGLQAWSQVLKPEFDDAKPYSGPEATHFIHHRWLLQPFVLPSVADYVFKYQGGARVHGRPTHVVVGFGNEDERTWFYFDKEKFLLLRWGGFGPIAGKQEPIDYSAYKFKKVSDVLYPQEMSLIVENDIFGRVVFESIQVNQPLDGIDFSMPESTVPVLRQRTVE